MKNDLYSCEHLNKIVKLKYPNVYVKKHFTITDYYFLFQKEYIENHNATLHCCFNFVKGFSQDYKISDDAVEIFEYLKNYLKLERL